MSNNNTTIEAKVAQTILQKPDDVSVAGITYKVAPPSVATLILVSEAVAKMPQVELSANDIVEESLRVAKDCRVEGEIAAIIILGAKGLTGTKTVEKEVKEVAYNKYLFGLIKRPRLVTSIVKEEVEVDRKADLAKQLLEENSPKELLNLTSSLLQGMQLSDFFGLTTFLIEINLTKQTRKVVTGTTASGR